MVLFLTGNVFRNGGDIGFADAEHPVSGLPGEVSCPFVAHPSRGVCFDHAGEIGGRLRRAAANEYVNVIRSAVDDKRGCAQFACDATDISAKIIPEIRPDQRPAVLKIKCRRMLPDVWDNRLSPLRGCWELRNSHAHGSRRGLHAFAAPRLNIDGSCRRMAVTAITCSLSSPFIMQARSVILPASPS